MMARQFMAGAIAAALWLFTIPAAAGELALVLATASPTPAFDLPRAHCGLERELRRFIGALQASHGGTLAELPAAGAQAFALALGLPPLPNASGAIVLVQGTAAEILALHRRGNLVCARRFSHGDLFKVRSALHAATPSAA
jgi:hypothetical protein